MNEITQVCKWHAAQLCTSPLSALLLDSQQRMAVRYDRKRHAGKMKIVKPDATHKQIDVQLVYILLT